MASKYVNLSKNLSIIGLIAGASLVVAGPSAGLDANALPAGVSMIEFGHGTRLTDDAGFTLYQFDGDLKEPGTSTCIDACALTHPPLLSSNTQEQIPSDWSLINREDGVQQWAYKERPLYRFVRDSYAGAAYGEGGGWTVTFIPIRTPPELSINGTTSGHVLASPSGLTLYTPPEDSHSAAFECRDDCLETWLPLKAPWAAINSDNFSVHARADGIYQWAYRNKPLYQYAYDSAPGDLNGAGFDGWKAMVLEPAPPIPTWVNIVGSDGGKLYANSNGMTLYTLNVERNNDPLQALGSNACDARCLSDGWNAVTAESLAAPVGKWSVIETENGTLQWAYLGLPLYTSKDETRPGELIATTRREYQWLKPIMYALPALQGVFN